MEQCWYKFVTNYSAFIDDRLVKVSLLDPEMQGATHRITEDESVSFIF